MVAYEVSINPRAQSNEPPKATFLYENFFRNGPTNNPDIFIITSRPEMTMAAPAVPTLRSVRMSLNKRPNDGSIPRVAN